jgi:predicted nuclease with RNAse H fold
VLILQGNTIIGLDLAGKEENPTGLAALSGKRVYASLIYTNKEILESVLSIKPKIVAIDAPLKPPKEGILRKADRELIKRGYRVLPPAIPGMKALTLRATNLNKLITEKGLKTIEVHPASTRKALDMPWKNLKHVQKILEEIGLEGSLKERKLTAHEIDAVTAALTAHLHIKGMTETLGDEEEGLVVIPKKQNWRCLKL